ncbi:MAG: hypothetical protein HUU01_11680 [Saprospiraceae bacterium]|nr:hypothetical protein [Saprospiraceae bacterium]
MKKLVLKIEESRFNLFVQFLQTLDYVTIEQPAFLPDNGESTSPKYDFSDLAGKLEWKGDAVDEQRLLREEW